MDSETTQVATETGVAAPPATEPSVNQPQAAPGAGETPQVAAEDKAIPYDRFKEVNDAKKAAEERAQLYEQQLRMMAQQHQQPQQQQPDIAAELGLAPEDLYSEDGIKKLASGVDRLVNRRLQAAQQQMQAQQFFQSHPDFPDLVGTVVGGQFVPSETWRTIQRQQPAVAQAIENSPNAALLAYEFAKKQAPPPPVGQQIAQQVRAMNAPAQTPPPSIAAAMGSGSISKIEEIRNMSDEEFQRHKESIIARAR